MKKKFLIIFSAVFTLGLFSCESFLDRYPKDQLSAGSFWKTIEDVERFSGDLYNGAMPDYGMVMGDSGSDDIVPGIKWADGNEGRGVFNPADYGWGYGQVRKACMLLENIDKIEDGTEAQKAVVKAEARFFRAYFYSGMVQSYGAVPYVETTLALDQLKVPRTPVAEVYAKVKEDLEFAATNLNLVEAGPRYGRVTQGAALTVLADLQMYLASFPEYQSFVTYADAAATAKRVIDSGAHALWDEGGVKGNYREYFWEPGDGFSEDILFRTKSALPGYESGMLGWETMPNIGWGGSNPTQSLVDAFEDSEGALLKDSKIYNPKEPWKNRDMRFETCIGYHGYFIDGNNWNFTLNTVQGTFSEPDGRNYPTGVGSCGDATATGYYQMKWVDRSQTPEYANQWLGYRDIIAFRFAEVLLWYAEAVNEVSGPTAEVFTTINRIRARVRQPLLQNSDASKPTYVADQQTMRERIQNEYRVEMCLEGKRVMTMRRFKQPNGEPLAMKVMNEPIVGMPYDQETKTPFVGPNTLIPARPDGIRFQKHNVLYPIPQSEIDLNKDLTQNPGYK